jgi:ankyrin repeat protein
VLTLNSRIHVFCSHHLDQVTRELLKAGAAVDNQTPKQVTALNMACDNAHEECAILLLQAGSRSADLADAWGDAPRSLAEKNGLQNALALM